MDSQQRAFEVLSRSQLFREFQTVFEHITGVHVTLDWVERYVFPRARDRATMRHRLRRKFLNLNSDARSTGDVPEIIHLYWTEEVREDLVPIRAGASIVGILRTGFVIHVACGRGKSRHHLRHLIRAIPVLDSARMDSLSKMLKIFAEFLARLSNQAMLQQSTCEPAIVSRAKQFIKLHHRESVLLEHVAAYSHASTFYLCKLFKKVTGLTFTDFLVRTRVETAKELLLDGRKRISEVAIESGFQSLTNFNRVFKELVGAPPRDFRKQTLT